MTQSTIINKSNISFSRIILTKAKTLSWKFRLSSMVLVLIFISLIAITFGSVSIPVKDVINILLGNSIDQTIWRNIVLDFRLPKIITALFAGAALGVSGLQMQTLFRNALAGPFVLGINSGASLGVALVVMGTGASSAFLGRAGMMSHFSVLIAAIIGAFFVLGVVMTISQRVQNNVSLLIIGLMLGAIVSSLVSVLIYFSTPEEIQSYIIWTFGSFRGMNWTKVYLFVPAVLSGLVMAACSIKHMNVLLLGESYAQSLGLPLKRVRNQIIMTTAILAGTVTAFCGPISFLGIAIPHLCRGLFNTSNHRVLFPAVIIMGACLALTSEIIAQLPGHQTTLPLNAVTSLIGGPIIIWIILHRRKVG